MLNSDVLPLPAAPPFSFGHAPLMLVVVHL